MDDTQEALFRALGIEADEMIDTVETALDDERANVRSLTLLRHKVDELTARYRKAAAALGEMDRLMADRTTGRKIMDLGRVATHLPLTSSGSKAAPIADNSFFATRPGTSSRKPTTIGLLPGESRRPDRPPHSVGGEVEGYCSKCDGIAVVDEQPAKVTCHACKTTHKFREEPEKVKVTRKPTSTRAAGGPTDNERKQTEKAALLTELRAVEAPRAYDPKQRFKVGEVISHGEHGKGKVELVLPRSLVVQFPAGRKTLKIG